MESSTKVLSDMYKLTGGKITLIGAGGVCNADDAYKKIRAGASLVQMYSSFSLQGPSVIPKIKRGLTDLLIRDKLTLNEAVGIDHKSCKL